MPSFRPGAWDLFFDDDLIVELDEELHFNRYRATTLGASWEAGLPWNGPYKAHCANHEHECVQAGCWGKRWTNPSTARMFSGGTVGDLDSAGAPRWKQRALYDAIKDLLPIVNGGHLARVATHDIVNGISLGSMLDGIKPIDPAGIRALVQKRTA